MRTLAALLLVVSASTAHAQISNDRLCQAIGDTPKIAVPPRDRAFFEDHCTCLDDECVYTGGARYKRLVAVVNCQAEVHKRISKALRREVGEHESLGAHDDLGVTEHSLCVHDPSSKRALRELAFAIRVQKQLDANAAEARRREEKEEAELQAKYQDAEERGRARRAKLTEDRAARIDSYRQELLAKSRAKYPDPGWERDIDEAVIILAACRADEKQANCETQDSRFRQICDLKPAAFSYCRGELERVEAQIKRECW